MKKSVETKNAVDVKNYGEYGLKRYMLNLYLNKQVNGFKYIVDEKSIYAYGGGRLYDDEVDMVNVSRYAFSGKKLLKFQYVDYFDVLDCLLPDDDDEYDQEKNGITDDEIIDMIGEMLNVNMDMYQVQGAFNSQSAGYYVYRTLDMHQMIRIESIELKKLKNGTSGESRTRCTIEFKFIRNESDTKFRYVETIKNIDDDETIKIETIEKMLKFMNIDTETIEKMKNKKFKKIKGVSF